MPLPGRVRALLHNSVLTAGSLAVTLGALEWAARWADWILDLPMRDVSATEVRRRLARGIPTDDLLDPEVRRYIEAHRLYGVAGAAHNDRAGLH